jgi:serine/threonine-protein kinase RsbW
MRGELRQFFDQRGIRADVSNDLILATQEACTNSGKHGADRAGCDVVVTCLDDTVVIEVADRGRGFDFETVKAMWPPPPLRSDGRGLFLIAELTDQIEVIRRPRGTLVRIFKLIR